MPAFVINDTSGLVISRVFVRATGAARWPASIWQGVIAPGQQVRLTISPGMWDVCIETPDGRSAWWNGIDVAADGVRLIGQDDSHWTAQECHTR